MRLAKSAFLASAVVLAGFSLPAKAQTVPDAADAPEAGATDTDIVVTARRREESAQTVPVSITALGARELEERQVRTLSDLTSVAPGVRFVAQGGSGNMNVVLRGLAKGAAADSPNSVVSYFGDIPLYFRGSDIPTFDLQNVQVLKGPQGTLFGRNSIGGAVLLVPQPATDRFEGYGRIAMGNYDLRDLEAAVNVPLSGDRLALRVAGRFTRRDGYVGIANQDTDGFDNYDRGSVRATFLVRPVDGVRNVTVVDYMEARETDANALLFAALPTGLVRTPGLAPFFDCGAAPSCDIDLALERQRAVGLGETFTWREPYLDRRLWGVQNRTEIDAGAVQFRGIIGYRETGLETHNEAQGNDFGAPRPAGPGLPLLASDIYVRVKQFSAEAQLVGTLFGNRLDWIVGYFHISEDPYDDNLVRTNVATITAPITHSFNYRGSDAAFAQVGFKVTGTLKLNAGYRHTWDSSRVCSGSSATPPASPEAIPEVDERQCAALTNSATVRYAEDQPTYTVGVDWRPIPEVFAYAAHRRGYRAGGVNSPAFVTPRTAILRPFQTYGSERLTDVEIGIKSDFSLAAMPVRFNVAGYRSRFSNVQTSFNVANLLGPPPLPADSPLFNALIINTGKRRFTGVEAELVLRPASGFTIGGNVAYIDQKVTDNRVPTDLPGLVAPSIVNQSPTWSTSVSGRWRLPVRPAGAEVYLNADYYYQSSFFVGNARLPGYDIANARLEVQDIGGSGIGAAAFVRNIFDNRYFDAGGATAASLGFFTGHIAEPRLYGAELNVRF